MVIFGQREANPVVAKVVNALRGGPKSLTDLHRALSNNMNKDRIKLALEDLVRPGRVQGITERTTGRPKTVFNFYETNELYEISSPAEAVLPVGNQLAMAV